MQLPPRPHHMLKILGRKVLGPWRGRHDMQTCLRLATLMEDLQPLALTPMSSLRA